MTDPYPGEREGAGPLRTASPTSWPCVICARESSRIFVQHGIGVRRCLRCGHEFAEFAPAADHVARVYGDDYFFGGGAGYSDYPSEAELLRAHGRRYAWLLRRFVDVGSPGTELEFAL